MANCLRAGAAARRCRSSSATGRTRSAAWRSRGRCSSAGYESFVGQFPIPMRHGMTVGELARLFNDAVRHRRRPRRRGDAGLATRDCTADDVGPALGDAVAEHARPSTRPSSTRARCCSRGRTLSEGRGTTRPFELVGAPWIDAGRVRRAHEPPRAARRALPAGGLRARRSRSTPRTRAAAARSTSRTARASGPWRPARRLIAEIRAATPRASRGASRPTNTSARSRRSTSWRGRRRSGGRSRRALRLEEIVGSWRSGEDGFRALRAPHLLY